MTHEPITAQAVYLQLKKMFRIETSGEAIVMYLERSMKQWVDQERNELLALFRELEIDRGSNELRAAMARMGPEGLVDAAVTALRAEVLKTVQERFEI